MLTGIFSNESTVVMDAMFFETVGRDTCVCLTAPEDSDKWLSFVTTTGENAAKPFAQSALKSAA
jgi:hypothetical protein